MPLDTTDIVAVDAVGTELLLDADQVTEVAVGAGGVTISEKS